MVPSRTRHRERLLGSGRDNSPDAPMSEPRAALEDQLPVTWDRAVNATVYSGERTYIDFTSGIFVANVGHSHPGVIAALRVQLDHQLLHTYTFPSASRMRLARKLCQVTGFERAFLLSTGAEAVEAALRIVRRATGRQDVVGWDDSMHGKTLGAQQVKHIPPRVTRYPFPHPMERFEGPSGAFAAALVETYQGWSARFLPTAYMQDVAEWCRRSGALLIMDEVQAGFARTGKLFGYEHYGVQPDLVCVGKGLRGGVPISAVLGSATLLDNDPTLTSTHSGNPLCCAAALATLEALESEHLVERAERLGHVIDGRLRCQQYPYAGTGMVWAVNMGNVEAADQVVEAAAQWGVLLLRTKRGTVKLGPPLTIPERDLAKGLDIITRALIAIRQSKERIA